ncbi:probable glutamate receptor [Centruroides sculpturatus]|uniref:probable glutamate receptor n=1 Tax=Centruroides sculpturatus TaxID=218467 RepID=UPI000C6CE88A|nr:probable glutamate receptor [Centruroides sculpturatus]
MIGMVHQQKADVAMTDLSITAEREQDIDFTYPYFFDPVCFVVKYPKEVSTSIVLLQPLKFEVYLASVFTIIVMSIAIYFVSLYESPLRGWSLLDAIWYLYGAMSFQGGTLFIPYSDRIRIMVASWWICCMIVMTGYSGTLISYLNVPLIRDGIDTVKELLNAVENGEIKAGTIDGTSILNNILMATKEKKEFYILGKYISIDPEGTITKNVEEGMKRVYIHQYALIFPRGPLEPIAARMEDQFLFSEDHLFVTCYAIAMPKGSPLKKIFRLPILRIMAGGLIQKWNEDLINAKRILEYKSTVNNDRRMEAMTLEDLRGALALLGIGLLISFIIFLIEIFMNRLCNNSRFQNSF